jgi:hypothetical protein
MCIICERELGASTGRLSASSSSRARDARSFRAPAPTELVITALPWAARSTNARNARANRGARNSCKPKRKSKAQKRRCCRSRRAGVGSAVATSPRSGRRCAPSCSPAAVGPRPRTRKLAGTARSAVWPACPGIFRDAMLYEMSCWRSGEASPRG